MDLNRFISEERGDAKRAGVKVAVGIVTILISLIIFTNVQSTVIGQPIYGEMLGNMSSNVTTFTLDNAYSTTAQYVTFALVNVTSITSAATGTAITEGTTAFSYAATSGETTLTVNDTINDGFDGDMVVWANYSSMQITNTQAYATANTIATSALAAFGLMGIMLVVLGAREILQELNVI